MAKTAVLVVDMQNDFGTKGGMFDRAGIDLSMIQRAVGPTAKVLIADRQMGNPTVCLKMGCGPDLVLRPCRLSKPRAASAVQRRKDDTSPRRHRESHADSR